MRLHEPARIEHDRFDERPPARRLLKKVEEPAGLCLGLNDGVPVRLKSIHRDRLAIVPDTVDALGGLAMRLGLIRENAGWTDHDMVYVEPGRGVGAEGGRKMSA